MENRAPEMRSNKGASIVENVRKWAHDHLTLSGREAALFTKKYAQVAEHLPNNITDSQLALIEMRLRQQAKSGAIGSIVMDVLVGGGALVGGGMLLNRMLEKRPMFTPAQREAVRRAEARSKHAFSEAAKLSGGLFKAGVELMMFPIKIGAKVLLWPARQVGKAGRYVWGMLGGPEAASIASYAVKNTLQAVPDTARAVKKVIAS